MQKTSAPLRVLEVPAPGRPDQMMFECDVSRELRVAVAQIMKLFSLPTSQLVICRSRDEHEVRVWKCRAANRSAGKRVESSTEQRNFYWSRYAAEQILLPLGKSRKLSGEEFEGPNIFRKKT